MQTHIPKWKSICHWSILGNLEIHKLALHHWFDLLSIWVCGMDPLLQLEIKRCPCAFSPSISHASGVQQKCSVSIAHLSHHPLAVSAARQPGRLTKRQGMGGKDNTRASKHFHLTHNKDFPVHGVVLSQALQTKGYLREQWDPRTFCHCSIIQCHVHFIGSEHCNGRKVVAHVQYNGLVHTLHWTQLQIAPARSEVFLWKRVHSALCTQVCTILSQVCSSTICIHRHTGTQIVHFLNVMCEHPIRFIHTLPWLEKLPMFSSISSHEV